MGEEIGKFAILLNLKLCFYFHSYLTTFQHALFREDSLTEAGLSLDNLSSFLGTAVRAFVGQCDCDGVA